VDGFWGLSVTEWTPGPALTAFYAGVTVVCELAAQFTDGAWAAATPCPEWSAADLAGHLRCVADDLNEYLDDAPASRLARLMATGADPARLARKLDRQNAAELASLAEGQGPEHIAAFAASARAYARRIPPVWDLPHHQYRDTVVTVGGMAGAACAEWHLHAWDLAWALGKVYSPANPDVLAAGWRVGMPHIPLGVPVAVATCGAGPLGRAAARRGADGDGSAGPAGSAGSGAWRALLRASGRPA
jgi:hypothetical protein